MEQSLELKWKNSGILCDSAYIISNNGKILKNLPEDFYRFQDYLDEKVRFGSIPGVIQAARYLLIFYDALMESGMTYPGNLKMTAFFHITTGRMIFADPEGICHLGDPAQASDRYNEYRAPEVVLGESVYTEETEKWTIAVYLYELFYHSGSPLKGRKSIREVFLNEEQEYRWMAQHSTFTMEENLWENQPVHGIQDRLLKYWDFYPDCLKNAFLRSFVDGKEHPSERLSIHEWQVAVNRTRTEYLICECGNRGFTKSFIRLKNGHYRCRKCANVFYTFECKENHLYLSNGVNLYQYQIQEEDAGNMEIIGQVVENRTHKGVFGIKNTGTAVWKALGKDGNEREIPPMSGIPIWKRLAVTFPNGDTWKIHSEMSEEETVKPENRPAEGEEQNLSDSEIRIEEILNQPAMEETEEVPTMKTDPPVLEDEDENDVEILNLHGEIPILEEEEE